mgnify:CR=1 FL=1
MERAKPIEVDCLAMVLPYSDIDEWAHYRISKVLHYLDQHPWCNKIGRLWALELPELDYGYGYFEQHDLMRIDPDIENQIKAEKLVEA